jgi:Predicted transmembrane transcriptional regulator (anti-sigma factor)
MRIMQCKEAKRLISSYIDGEISPDKRRDLEGHLLICSDCRRELEMMEKIVKLIHELPEIEPSEELSDKIWVKYALEKGDVSKSTFRKFLLILGFVAFFGAIIFFAQNYFKSQSFDKDIYSYYNFHGKMSTSINENTLVDLVLYQYSGK